jgi:uncharacterized protein DUF3106
MKRRIQFGKWLLAVASIALLALPCAAQKHDNKPPQPQRQQQPKPQRQERRQQQQENRRAQNNRPNVNRPGNDGPRNAGPIRQPQNRQPDSMGMIGGNRPPNTSGESGQPNLNPNRPPNASNQARNLSPQERQKLQQDERRFRQFPPQQQQEMRDRARVWGKLTPDQQNHIKGDILPKWQQMSSQRQKAVRQRLGVLQNMPESARNQHLNDPNFTRGMSEEDKAMLRDLSHMHVGAPDPPNE